MLSRTSEYALRAMLYLAERDGGGPIRATEVSMALGVPANYLAKILHRLGRHGLLVSERGRNGGFSLARPPSSISLEQVVDPLEGLSSRGDCLLGRGTCSDGNACAVHGRWGGVRDRVTRFFGETTLADLLAGGGEAREGRDEFAEARGGDHGAES